jgi:hypothetical protein
MPLRGDVLLMSFKGMREIYPSDGGAAINASAPTHLSDEFPAGYSLTRCSPAELVSASPAEVEYARDVANSGDSASLY